MADAGAGGAAGEAAVGDQRDAAVQAEALDVAGRSKHLLHARPAARPLVAHDDDVAGLDLLVEDAVGRLFLAAKDDRGPLVDQHLGQHAGGLDHAALGREVAVQHAEAAGLGVRVALLADHVVDVGAGDRADRRRRRGLAQQVVDRGDALGRHGRAEPVDLAGLVGAALGAQVPLGDVLAQGLAGDRRAVEGQQALVIAQQGAEDGVDAAGDVDVLDVVLVARRDLAQVRGGLADVVDAAQVVVDLGLLGQGQGVEDGVGAAAHGHVHAQRVVDRLAVDDVARLEILVDQLDDAPGGPLVELAPLGRDGQGGAGAGQGQAEDLGQTVHRVGRVHARTGAAGRTGDVLDAGQLLVAHLAHLVLGDAVEGAKQVGIALARGHRPARDDDRRHVGAQGGHHHAGGDLVAVGDADHAVEAVRLEHRLDGVGDQVAAGQRELHPAVAHGDAVVDADGVEDEGHAARGADRALDELADGVEVGVAGDDVDVTVDHRDERAVLVTIDKVARRPQQAAMRRTMEPAFDGIRTHNKPLLGGPTLPTDILRPGRERGKVGAAARPGPRTLLSAG